jgi:hypothetical protein
MNHEDSNRFIDATSGIKICISFIGKTHTYINCFLRDYYHVKALSQYKPGERLQAPSFVML